LPDRHSIVSIGAVDLLAPSAQFYAECRPWEGAELEIKALSVNGYTPEQLLDPARVSLTDAVRDFLAWTRGCRWHTLAGGNPAFDASFLKSACERAGIMWTLGHRTVDLHSLVYASYVQRDMPLPGKDGYAWLTIDQCFRYVGLGEEPRPHVALTGAKMEAEALWRLIRGKYLLDEFREWEIPDYLVQDRDREEVST
jgi:DNA polymerase III epsilon subunit-like protein